jgi:hypothetical protein
MPSDTLGPLAMQAVRARADAFRSAVALTAEQLRGMISAQRDASAGTSVLASATLGAFAAGRINADRFARVLTPGRPLAADRSALFKRALAILEEIGQRGDDLFHLRVEPGADLHGAVERALAEAGRVFLAARLAGKSGSAASDDRGLASGFPFRRWSRAERRLAPPLVIEIEGGDLIAAGLASYLDGDVCFIVLVSGEAPPAAFARLIAPGVLVAQVTDGEALQQLAGFAGPAAIGVMAPEAALFVHRPIDDGGLGTVEVTHAPLQEPHRPIGSTSVFQQQQDRRLLNTLANGKQLHPEVTQAPAATGVPNGPEVVAQAVEHSNGQHPAGEVASVDPVATLAAWLLSRVDLSDLEGGGS